MTETTIEYQGFQIREEMGQVRVWTKTAEALRAWRAVGDSRAVTIQTDVAHCGDFDCTVDEIKEQIDQIIEMAN